MPTFTIPGSPASTSVPTSTPAKKTNNRRKKAVEPEPAPAPEPEPVQAVVAPEPEPELDVTNVSDQDQDQDPNSPVSEPTFPNIVILKQTDHNYIVKHNHYPVTSSSSSSSSSHHDKTHLQPLVADDLVSPNQIHKGQINKKREENQRPVSF